MENSDSKERGRALLALQIEALHLHGKSFSEIARALSTPERPLTRSAAIGILNRLRQARADDARDLAILLAAKAGKETLIAVATRFRVTPGHVLDLIDGAIT